MCYGGIYWHHQLHAWRADILLDIGPFQPPRRHVVGFFEDEGAAFTAQQLALQEYTATGHVSTLYGCHFLLPCLPPPPPAHIQNESPAGGGGGDRGQQHLTSAGGGDGNEEAHIIEDAREDDGGDGEEQHPDIKNGGGGGGGGGERDFDYASREPPTPPGPAFAHVKKSGKSSNVEIPGLRMPPAGHQKAAAEKGKTSGAERG